MEDCGTSDSSSPSPSSSSSSPSIFSSSVSLEAATSPSECLQLASKLQNSIPPDLHTARKFYEKAYAMSDEDEEVLDNFAEFLCHFGDENEAVDMFKKSAAIYPEGAPMKYFYLGELSSCFEALQYFQKCLQLLEKNSENGKEEEERINEKKCSVCCSIAELYMSDLCDEDDAQEECAKYIDKSIAVHPSGFEGHSCRALFNKVIGNFDVALEAAKKCIQILKDTKKDEFTPSSSFFSCYPSIETRVNFCRTLIDLNETEEAIRILEDCFEEDEENEDVWEILRVANLVKGDAEAAEECKQKIKQLRGGDEEEEEGEKGEEGGGEGEEGKGENDEWMNVEENEMPPHSSSPHPPSNQTDQLAHHQTENKQKEEEKQKR